MTVCQEVFDEFMDNTGAKEGFVGIDEVDTMTLHPPEGYDPECIYIFDSKVSVVAPLPAGIVIFGLLSQLSPELKP